MHAHCAHRAYNQTNIKTCIVCQFAYMHDRLFSSSIETENHTNLCASNVKRTVQTKENKK